MEQRILSSEAAEQLGIGVRTLRSYVVALEETGYSFERGTRNRRIFGITDLNLFAKMVEIISGEGLTIRQAAESVISTVSVKTIDTTTSDLATLPIEKLGKQISQLEDRQIKLAETNLMLISQVERLTEKLEERERDQALFQRMENVRLRKKRKGSVLLRPLTILTGKK